MAAILRSKAANRFRITFDNFGSDENGHLATQVLRVTRPGVVFYSVFGTPEIAKHNITMILRDDVNDITRSEICSQVIRQSKGASFSLMIETLSSSDAVLEQWHLTECRIQEFQPDELDNHRSEGLTIRLVIEPTTVLVSQDGKMVELITGSDDAYRDDDDPDL